MKKLFRNISLVLVIVTSNSLNVGNVNGDVYLIDRRIENKDDFIRFIQFSFHEELSNNIFPENITWQMPGCAVFFSENSADTHKVYIAKKRIGNQIANNNPQNGGHVLSYSSNMHTERQLAIVALEDALGGDTPLNVNFENDDQLMKGAKVPLKGNVLFSTYNHKIDSIRGDLHIYTREIVCQQSQEDNHGFSCPEYYRELAKMFPNVAFHIYTRRKGITFDKKMNISFRMNFLTYVSNYYDNFLHTLNIPIDTGDEAHRFFKVSDAKIQYRPTLLNVQWKPLINSNEQKAIFPNDFVTAMQSATIRHRSNIVEPLLNHTFSYGMKNITYHIIDTPSDKAGGDYYLFAKQTP